MQTPRRTRTILFLIADTGAGHRSAANAIVRALDTIQQQDASAALVRRANAPTPAHTRATLTPASAHVAANRRGAAAARSTRAAHATSTKTSVAPSANPSPNTDAVTRGPWRAVIVDAFAECSQFPLRNTVSLYGPAVKYSPRLYGQIYRMTNTVERFKAARRLTQPFLRQGLRRLIEQMRPDVIVSIHPLLNHITLQVLRDIGLRIPFITVVTDLVSMHCAWMAPGVDACVVPTAEAKALALSVGVAPRRIHVLGMPIDPKFAHQPADTLAERRRKLGLDPETPVILLVGGGEGAGGLAEAALALGDVALPAQLVVITGRNKLLYAELERLRANFKTPLHIEGFVTNMPDFMWAADVVVTKAGPGSISEAMACELPVILTGAIPGQEEGNIEFVLENGLGALITNPELLATTLRDLLDPANPTLARYRENVRRHRRANASFDIARLITSYLPQPAAPSVWDSVRQRASARSRRRSTLNPRDIFPRDLSPRDLLPPFAIPPLPTIRRNLGARDLAPLPSVSLSARRSALASRRRIAPDGPSTGVEHAPKQPSGGRSDELELWRSLLRPFDVSGVSLSSVTRYRLLQLASLTSVRALLRRNRGQLLLRRPGGRRGRYDARPTRGGGSD